MTKNARTKLIAVVLAGAAATVLYIELAPGARPRVAPREAAAAADSIVREEGGGEQAKGADGVPADAATGGDPGQKPGPASFSK